MTRDRKILHRLLLMLLSCTLVFSQVLPLYAEEYYEDDGSYDDDYEEETEFIPEEYYYPIQTNDIEGWPVGEAVQAASAIVMDMDTGTILYGKSVDEPHYPASITKIMTTLVALENGNLDDVIICPDEVYDIEKDSTHLGIQPGEEITLRQALYGLMLESANDLGMAIAMHIAGSIEGFADMMNAKAQSLGCTSTHFMNPHGLHNDNHYTTAHDMAKIATAAYQNEMFRAITSTTESSIPPTNLTEETRYFANHQKLLQPESDYYQPWCTGGKTGFTSMAWNTLVTYGEKNGLRLVCVLLHENGAGRSYLETTDLMNYGFDQFEHITLGTDIEAPTFYDILKLNQLKLSDAAEKSQKLMEKTMQRSQGGSATVPVGTSASQLTSKVMDQENGKIRYYYNGWPVGQGSIAFSPIPAGLTYEYKQGRNMEAILEQAVENRKQNDLEETADLAWRQLWDLGQKGYAISKEYVENNKMTVLLAGALVLVVLIILIIILILRCTKDSRIRKKRIQAEKAKLRREEEIERASAVEIEEELREAMNLEKERKRKVEEKRQRRLAEEKKLREAEEVLEEINRIEEGTKNS